MHTGENQFTCMTCDGTFKRQVDQIDHNKSCAGDVVNVFELNSRDNSLMAYMCKACNYIQIHESSMKKHMTIQHGFDSTAENYEKVVFIPDLSPIQSMVSERYRHTPTEQRYKNYYSISILHVYYYTLFLLFCDYSSDINALFATKSLHRPMNSKSILINGIPK